MKTKKNARCCATILTLMCFIPITAVANCVEQEKDSELALCLATELWGVDQRINHVYQNLMSRYQPEEKVRLRDEQRSWLKLRDTVCRLDNRETKREAWIRKIAENYQQTVCVVRFTRQRVEQLERYAKKSDGHPEPGVTQKPVMTPDQGVYELATNTRKERGKWYFEVKFEPARIVAEAETALFIGFEDQSGGSVGRLLHLRQNFRSVPKVNMGFAIDLDNGKFYRHVNGKWGTAVPGSAEGMDIKHNGKYRAKLTSTVPITTFVARQYIDANFGQKPFEYALPAGYRPIGE